jgi:hypothetical protein
MKKEKAAQAAISQTQRKGNTISLKYKVLSELNAGKFTASELNRTIGFNDSRKIISVLRQSGYSIGDKWTGNGAHRHKIYFAAENRQLSLFEKGGEQ